MSHMAEESRPSFFERFAPMLVLIVIVMAGALGYLFNEVKSLKSGGTTNTAGTQQQAPAPATVDLATIKGIFDKNVVKFGDNSKKVLFVEVGDPSCPYCHIAGGNNPELASQVGAQFKYDTDGGTYMPPVREMKKLVDSGKASYAYIYFPGHGNGEMGAKALFCANDQEKFWDVHSVLYSNKGYDYLNNTIKNDKTKVKELVSFIGGKADSGKLTECLNSGKYDKRLAEDQDLASTLAISGTPGFFVNDKRFDGAYSFTDMQSTVDEALK